ncbi:TPA: endo-beta-N-acetylglucosaminidase [Streptococcus pyogenes]|uniref:EndoS/ChiA family endoglycosidase n=1 Tax=Streptococcus pyogenes TaxID=1314 RepID=UPI000E059F62|nr:endo-beta-N-acetylglucosaminidase [Streptococcus pyogenes]WSE68446.1 endo-beta-N-acetylglucosaminidase [Streptococcus pyogenes]SUO74131.1 endo-beta-N-acetylglucosaminidase [Streptococcus pyogenes]VGT75032.1 endo-beta-N-acetylglucosaminidase [Streptococcus pyogenes]HEP1376169.1 endo-beta-N-acetylglucosaminidase [Streptococcus pyogenes]HEP2074612.1 endo-beta-N-acetylglucosaminidase [Streptococcus pyogenes]
MDKHLLVKRTLGCVCAATLMGAALATHHDSLNTVKAEEKTVQTGKTDQQVGAKLVQEIREGKRGPLYAGYFRTWHDRASTGIDGKQQHPENTMAEVPKEVDILFVFHDHTASDSPFWSELKDSYVHKLHQQGTALVQTIGVNELNGRTGLSKDYPDTPEGNKALAAAIVKAFVTDRGVDGLDIDIEHEFTNKRTPEEDARALNVFKEIAQLIGKNGSDKSKLLIMDTTLSVENNPIFKGIAEDLDYLLRQYYGSQGGEAEVDTINSDWNQYQNYIDASQFMIGFSFFEESASKGNLWFDVNEYDPNNPEKGKDIEGTRAKKYAEWQPSTGGLKAGIFSYAIDRDGVAHVPSTYKNRTSTNLQRHEVDNISHTDYTVSRKLKTLMTEDKRYDVIDQKDIPDPALREQIIQQVGQYKGDLERYNKTLVLTGDKIQNLKGLEKLSKLQKLELRQLSNVKEITPELLPESMKKDAELVMVGMTGLEKLNLSGLNRQTLDGIDVNSITHLTSFDISHNSLDLSEKSEDRKLLMTLMEQVSNHQKITVKNTAFENQKPKGYYPQTYDTKEGHYDIDNAEHDILTDFVFGTVTKRNTFIGDEEAFAIYKEGAVDGRQYVSKDYTYEAFRKDYKGYKVHLTASNLGETVTSKVTATTDETYLVDVSDGEKVVHHMKLNIGSGAIMMENLAKGAKVIGTSGDFEQAKKIFDGEKSDRFFTWGQTNWIAFDLGEINLAKEWRLFNAETNTEIKTDSSLNVAKGRLQILKDTTINLEKMDIKNRKEYLSNDENWTDVAQMDDAKAIFNSKLSNVLSRYWRFCVDGGASSYYPQYTELQILGQRLSNDVANTLKD